jgi:hypothetical protein
MTLLHAPPCNSRSQRAGLRGCRLRREETFGGDRVSLPMVSDCIGCVRRGRDLSRPRCRA